MDNDRLTVEFCRKLDPNSVRVPKSLSDWRPKSNVIGLGSGLYRIWLKRILGPIIFIDQA